MQLRGATLLALSFLVCAVIGTADQATSSPFQSSVSPQVTAPGTLTGFAGLTPANEEDILVDVDPAASEPGGSLLAAFVMLTMLFGLMAVPTDPLSRWQPARSCERASNRRKSND